MNKIVNKTLLIAPVALSAIAIAMSACAPSGSAGKTIVGTVTGFGSVYVNGAKYETDTKTTVTIEGKSATEADLDPGMKVTITGSQNPDGMSGDADHIEYDDEVEGPVTTNGVGTTGTGTMVVMGQNVEVKLDTVFESDMVNVTSIDQVTAGMVVEVSGASDGNGNIIATYVKAESPDEATFAQDHPDDDMDVEGQIAGLNTGAKTFTLGAATIDYSTATMNGFDEVGGIADGQYVEVSAASTDGKGNVNAAQVELHDVDGDDSHEGEDGEDFEIEGAITSGISGDTFKVDGQTIQVTDNTEFDGVDRSGLVVGVVVEVDGEFSGGVVIADAVEIEEEADGEHEGTVENETADSITVSGATVMTFTINNDTIMEDDVDAPEPDTLGFNVGSLATGDFVNVKYYTDGTTQMPVATKITRESGM